MLTSLVELSGVGSALLGAEREKAKSLGCRRLWLITTNDNTDCVSTRREVYALSLSMLMHWNSLES